MKLLKTASLAIGVALLTLSCDKNVFCTSGNGNVITENRHVSSFNRVISEVSLDVYLSNDSEPGIIIEASSNLMHLIETKVSGSTLTIDIKNNNCVDDDDRIKVYVSSPGINELEIRGSGNAFNIGTLTSYNLITTIKGSGDINFDQLNVQNYTATIHGSGDISLAGSHDVNNGYISINGSGDINAYEMIAKNVEVDIAGSGTARVHATEHLEVTINGSGDVYYKGNPIVKTSISGSGNIEQR